MRTITIVDATTGETQVRELTADEIRDAEQLASDATSEMARGVRDNLLAMSDWRVLPDATGNVEAWRNYREALRDLPTDPDWPNVVFPDPPEVN